MDDFYRTRMGQVFYERTMPALVEQIERLSKGVESLADRRNDLAIQELVDHATDLAAAVEHVLDIEIVPGSATTRQAFDELRANAAAVRRVLAKFSEGGS